jgi:hypothetical protein
MNGRYGNIDRGSNIGKVQRLEKTMTDNEYVEAVLRDQTLVPGGSELTELERQRKNVVAILDKKLGSAKPIVRKGGSWAKGTMNREVYDLDLPTYFSSDENGAGETLEEIYNNVAEAMSEDYFVERRRSALRLRAKDGQADTHIDLVPGRSFDATEGDAWIYQNNADKCRLKTNLDVHITHIRDSGVRPAIRLTKLWNVRDGIGMKTFVLELLVVDLLKQRKTSSLTSQLRYIFEQFRDNADSLSVTDPANGNNDLTPALRAVKSRLVVASARTLAKIEKDGWQSVFGPVTVEDKRAAAFRIAAAVPVAAQYRPHAE